MLTTIAAFLLTILILVAVHEYGHYRVAVACGVKVLRFSIGFGKVFYRWKPKKQKPNQDTEFVLSCLPLGGYVQMLDEREAPVAPEERHLAFNTQPLRSRVLIVLAGPVANFLLAIVLYTGVNWWGIQEPQATVASPVAGSLAEQAGLRGGQTVQTWAFDEEEAQPLRSFSELRWRLMQGVLHGQDLRLQVSDTPTAQQTQEILLRLSQLHITQTDGHMLRQIGITAPWTPAGIREVQADSPAQRAGLQSGDQVLTIDGTPVQDGQQLLAAIRAGVKQGEAQTQNWQIERNDQRMTLTVTPQVQQEKDQTVGKIGAAIGGKLSMVDVRYGPIDGVIQAVRYSWEVCALTLRSIGKMITGELSLKNLSGPLTIADYAGRTAQLGWLPYILFLALLSLSVGLLNLLPIPALDGGHLACYLWEFVRGKPLSDDWILRLQRVGGVLLMVMMLVALFNDLTRLGF